MIKNRQLWMWAGTTIVFLGILYLIQGILMPFLTGLLVAYAMNPAVKCFEKWGISRTFATCIMIFSFFLLIGLFLFIAIPFIQTELLILASRVPQYGDRILVTLQPYIDNASLYIKPEDVNRLRELASSYFGDVITWGIKLLVKILTSGLALANLLSLIVITPIVAFYFLRDWNKIIQAIDSWLPRPYEPTLRQLFTEMNNRIGGFAKGQSLVCLLVGTYYVITLTLAHLDFSVVVGMVIGVIAFIPYVGALVGFMLSMGIAFSQFSDWASIGIIAGIFAVGQTLEGYLFIPYLVGDRIGLHPVWVLFSLLVGGVLYGFIGILFALPVAAAMGVLVRYLLETYLKSPYYLGSAPLKAN
ncbi:MAG: AI-2E family transporter [Alphaproteobacteria bacterium]|nr:AI-2E family transporter [Alphaproteobacteria bacterium]